LKRVQTQGAATRLQPGPGGRCFLAKNITGLIADWQETLPDIKTILSSALVSRLEL
jgi:hypothetical protein